MKRALRIISVYVALAVALSCVSLTFEWLEPIVEPAGTWEYYAEIGVRKGVFMTASHIPPGGRHWEAELHAPAFFPLPVYAGAGAEGGGIYVAVWFPLALAATLHLLWRTYRNRHAIRASPANPTAS